MATNALTDRFLRSLSTTRVQEDIYDPSFPAFMVRVGRSGSRTFYFRYRSDDGRYRRVQIGKFPAMSLADARTRARELQVGVMRGADPAEERSRYEAGATVADLSREFIERYAKRNKKSWQEDARLLNVNVLPVWGHLKAADLRRRDVLQLLDGIGEHAPVLANRVLSLLRKMFNWGLEVELVEQSPCTGVRKPYVEKPRRRVLKPEEIRAVWRASLAEKPAVGGALRLLLLTGQRPGEVCRLRWDLIEGDLWTIPAEIAKNGDPHVVPLSPQALRELDRLRGLHPEWVLLSPRGSDKHVTDDLLSHAAARIRRQIGSAHWRPHDLRRTVATGLGELGVLEFTIQRVLGHAYRTTTSIYNLYAYLKEKREALHLWGEHVARLVAQAPPEPDAGDVPE